MKTIIEFESVKMEVETEDINSLREAMLFKASHIKAKAEPCLFKAVADALSEWHPYPEEKPTSEGFYLTTELYFQEIRLVNEYKYENGDFESGNVIAWKELPKPYEG